MSASNESKGAADPLTTTSRSESGPSRVSWLTVMIVVFGLGGSVSLCVALYSRESRLIDAEFRMDAEEKVGLLERKFRQDMEVVYALRAFFEGSDVVERDGFRVFVDRLLSRYPAIQALEWVPRIAAADREAHETATRDEGFDGYQIREKSPAGLLVPVAERSQYFPAHFVEPYEGNESALGFDVGSERIRLAALEQARDTGQTTVTAPLKLVQETGDQSGVLVCEPVFKDGKPAATTAERRESLQGYIVCVLRVGVVAELALASKRTEACLHLVDETDGSPGETLLVFPCDAYGDSAEAVHGLETMANKSVIHVVPLAMAGRDWKVMCVPAPSFISERRTMLPLLALIVGITMTGLATLNVTNLIERNCQVEATVSRRTVELHEANETLRREAAVRRQAEELFRALLESAPDAVVIVDSQGAITLVNAVAEQLFGYGREELIGESIEVLVPQGRRERHQALRQDFHDRPNVRPMGAGAELIGLRKDGSQFPAEISLGPLQAGDESLVIGVVRDVTERKRVATERRHQEAQLIAAQRIQQHMLPDRPPTVAGFDIAGALFPMEFAAGDHFDFLSLGGEAVGIVVGDVAGHGFASALLMASTRALLRSHAQNGSDVGRILFRTNDVLCRELEVDRFVTMLFVRLDPRTRSLSYASAGHPSGYVIAPTGEVKSSLDSTALPLGVKVETQFPTIGPLPLEEGDVVLLLTDGVVEVASSAGEPFGSVRAITFVHENRHRSAEEIVEGLYGAIRDFEHHHKLKDDATLVVIKVEAQQAV